MSVYGTDLSDNPPVADVDYVNVELTYKAPNNVPATEVCRFWGARKTPNGYLLFTFEDTTDMGWFALRPQQIHTITFLDS